VAEISAISRKLACKVHTLLHLFSKNIIKFTPLYVTIILREQIFRRKSRKGEAICGYCKPYRRIYAENLPLKTGSI